MKLLLAGGAGYVGSLLAPALIEHGYEVDVIDLLWFGDNLPDEVKVIKKNLFECKEEELTVYDQIIFLAGLSNDPMAEYSPSENFVSNAALPAYLAYIAKKAGVKRFIYASSCSVYGYTVDEMFDEKAEVSCAYPYGISKLQGERGVFQMQDENFSVIALRKGTVCGYSPRMRFDLVVNTMFKCAMKDGLIRVSNPAIWRPILDIRDAVSAYIRAVQATDTISGVYNIASDNYTVGQIGDIVKEKVETLSGKQVRVNILQNQDFRNYKVKTDRAKTYLGFESRFTVEDIIDELFEHIESYGDFEKGEFYNIRVFKRLASVRGHK